MTCEGEAAVGEGLLEQPVAEQDLGECVGKSQGGGNAYGFCKGCF